MLPPKLVFDEANDQILEVINPRPMYNTDRRSIWRRDSDGNIHLIGADLPFCDTAQQYRASIDHWANQFAEKERLFIHLLDVCLNHDRMTFGMTQAAIYLSTKKNPKIFQHWKNLDFALGFIEAFSESLINERRLMAAEAGWN